MKARVKATGEIIEVIVVQKYSSNDEPLLYYESIRGGVFYKEEHLDFENLIEGLTDVKEKSLPKDEPDYWEKLKHQAAITAMQGLLSNSLYLQRLMVTSIEDVSLADDVTMCAYDYATTLINKLKEEEK